MNKKVGLVPCLRTAGTSFAGLVFVVFAAFLAVEGAEAFCVYNKTDRVVRVEQVSGQKAGKGFSVKISPDDKRCCNWQTPDCNKEGKRDSKVSFDVYTEQTTIGIVNQPQARICADFGIEAGGWMTVVKKNDSRGDYYTCEGHK